jgi:hypothetical protein
MTVRGLISFDDTSASDRLLIHAEQVQLVLGGGGGGFGGLKCAPRQL